MTIHDSIYNFIKTNSLHIRSVDDLIDAQADVGFFAVVDKAGVPIAFFTTAAHCINWAVKNDKLDNHTLEIATAEMLREAIINDR